MIDSAIDIDEHIPLHPKNLGGDMLRAAQIPDTENTYNSKTKLGVIEIEHSMLTV